MAGNVLTSTIHTLGQDAAVNTPTSQEQAAAPTHPFRDYDASTQAPEDGRVPMFQSPGNTPSASPISKTPKDVPVSPISYAPNSAPDASSGLNVEEARGKVVEEINEEVICESRLTVCIQQLLKTVEAAVNPAQGIPHLKRGGVNIINCMLPGDRGAQLGGLLIDGFLISVDVFQQEGKFTGMQGDILADLSQADLEEAYLQAGVSFQVSKWCLDELWHQVSCDTRQQGTEVSKQLPGSCSKASVQQLSLTNL